MPLTSLSRRIARPPTTWPSASIGRPVSVVSVIENFSPRSRRPSTAASIACAASGSSQRPKASTRCGASASAHERDVADDLGLVVAGRPGHQDLRLRAQQRIDAVDLGAAGDDLVARTGFGVGQALAGAHQQDRRHHGEAEDRQRDRHADDLVAVEQREGVEIGVDDRRRGAGGVGSAARALSSAPAGAAAIGQQSKESSDRDGDAESAAPRMSLMAPAGGPDRVRHNPIAPIRRIPGARRLPLEPQASDGQRRLAATPPPHGRPRINGL